MELRPERVVHLEGSSAPNFQLEAQRGGLYLLREQFHPFIFEMSRLGAQLVCWLAMDFDPRKNYGEKWNLLSEKNVISRLYFSYLDVGQCNL